MARGAGAHLGWHEADGPPLHRSPAVGRGRGRRERGTEVWGTVGGELERGGAAEQGRLSSFPGTGRQPPKTQPNEEKETQRD